MNYPLMLKRTVALVCGFVLCLNTFAPMLFK